MSGLFGSLSIALSGLSVSQQEMATTSNNVANANTPGYTREVSDTAAGDPVEVGALSLGTGVVLEKIESLRDPMLANPNQSSDATEQLAERFADATAADSNPVRELQFGHRRRHQQFL